MGKLSKIAGIGVILIMMAFVLYQGTNEYLATGRTSQGIATQINELIVAETGSQERSVDTIELILRKLAHYIEYLMLGTIIFAIGNRLLTNKGLSLLLFLTLTLPLPFIDEFAIQSMTLGRSPQLLDVLIDLMGIGTALIIGVIYEMCWLMKTK